MRLDPDAAQAAEERAELARTTQAALARVNLTVSRAEAVHPAVIESAHVAQRILRADGDLLVERLLALGRMLEAVRAGIAARDPLWPIELTPARPHLERSVARALKSIPPRTDATGAPAESVVVSWRAGDIEAFDRALDLLAATWPAVREELFELLVQVALLRGAAIDGCTDFEIHGAILLNRARLGPSPAGLPGRVRLAEALVHEGTHTRCNAAAITAPFVRPSDGPEPLVATADRADPRPLGGLFRQAVVLARSVELYERLLAHDRGAPAAVRARRDRLGREAAEVVHCLGAHLDALTEHGRTLIADAADAVRAYA